MFKTSDFIYGADGRRVKTVFRVPHDLPDADMDLKQVYALSGKTVPWKAIHTLIEKSRDVHQPIHNLLQANIDEWYSRCHSVSYNLAQIFKDSVLRYQILDDCTTHISYSFWLPDNLADVKGRFELFFECNASNSTW